MNFIYFLLVTVFVAAHLAAADFTICSYNCGGLSEHYDYLRAAAMQKVVQERHEEEPGNMLLMEKIQKLALKKLFADTPEQRSEAEKQWIRNGYEEKLSKLVQSPGTEDSINAKWHDKAEAAISTYKVRPVVIHDTEVIEILSDTIGDFTGKRGEWTNDDLLQARTIMGQRIFQHQLKYDIICLQEADYLTSSMFPEKYEVLIPDSTHLKNGIAWNRDRFDFVEDKGSLQDRVHVVKLLDKETGKTVLVATGHLTGCNPFLRENGVNDSQAGDSELSEVVELFDGEEADIKLVAMDSNVTASHPRLKILQEAGYRMDYKNFLEPTCTNPYQVFNTRIDWIAMKVGDVAKAALQNIPVLNVGLNTIQTNISDHKPIAAKVTYFAEEAPQEN